MTKQEVLNKLQEYPEDELLWDVIADLFAELDELEKLGTFSVLDAERGYDWQAQDYYPRLHELELKFGV